MIGVLHRSILFAVLSAPLAVTAGTTLLTNMPSECSSPKTPCGCPQKGKEGVKDDGTEENSCPADNPSVAGAPKVDNDCIKILLDLGMTTPWTGSMSCSLKLFADDEASDIFHSESLYPDIGGYTFKRLGQETMPDGRTPAEVVFNHPRGEAVHFVFRNGGSWGMPKPGVHIEMDERLMMVDAEGWATVSDPVYWDLYAGDGTRRRFLATNKGGRMGSLVSFTDARGVTVTPEEMGVDLVYDEADLKQVLAPCRLAHVEYTSDWTGYDISIYPLTGKPRFDAARGLYELPSVNPVSRLGVRPEKDGKRAVVTVATGGGEPQVYTFDYLMGEWSLVRPSGLKEEKERYVRDMAEAQIVKTVKSASDEILSRRESNFKWESWGFAMTNRVEGFGGVTDTTSWTYYTGGNGKGQVESELRQSGLLVEYAYDAEDRVVMKRRSGPGMMAGETTYDYAPVDACDPVLSVDTRPRTVVRKLNGIECERTYRVYSPLTNIVERAAVQGAPYGATNALRTVTAFYPAAEGDLRSGFVKSIRHEDGEMDAYDYALASNLWTRTITHLHEQAPAPVSGKTTRDVTVKNAQGYLTESRTEAFIEGVWHVIANERYTRNAEGKAIRKENLARQVTTTDWDCCRKTHEIKPDGSATAWDYDDEGRLTETSRLVPLDMTNQTWVSTCYRYDELGRQIASWQTNATMHAGLPVTRKMYDPLGRVTNRVDALGNDTTTTYSHSGLIASIQYPDTSTRITRRNPDGYAVSVAGTAVTPEFYSYGILPDGTRWTKIVYGETPDSPRFTKRYENMLGQTVREERSGFQGAVLATTYAYDTLGRIVATVADGEPATEYVYDSLGGQTASVQRADGQWRKTETAASFSSLDGNIWLVQTNIASCSDAAVAPLVSSSSRQLTGLAAALPSRTRSTDIRGNATECERHVSSPVVTTFQIVPYATNRPLTISKYGVLLMDVSVSAVTNTYAYDALGRKAATTDGRGNATRIEYNVFGGRESVTDAAGNTTRYAYDALGRNIAVTNALGVATVYEYDARGNKTYEGGGTYPVAYAYDVYNVMTNMTTYRAESSQIGDATSWAYDEATGLLLAKTYSDGKGPSYTYTPNGNLATRTWARGIVTTYSYDGWNNLTNTAYSDGTPSISLAYDAMGRQTSATDAAGTATTTYDNYGDIASETTTGLYDKTLARHRDAFGRDLGYTIDNSRKSIIEYEADTGRMKRATMAEALFTYHYLPGTDLKSRLQYDGSGSAYYAYEPHRDLLTQVQNHFNGGVISQYDYVNDAIGRRTAITRSGSMMSETRTDHYDYNNRNELTNAVKNATLNEYAYQYDDIGNRLASLDLGTNHTYTANSLNQYTQISNLCDSASLREEFFPQFDDDMRPRRRRRVARRSVATEPRSGRKRPRSKNVSEIVFFQQQNGIAAHYEYAPFGAVTVASRSTPVTAYDFREYNPFRFSSEYSVDGIYSDYPKNRS